MAEPDGDVWRVNEWLKKAVLLSFRLEDNRVVDLGAARAYDKQAIDGPYLQIRDVEGYRRVAERSAALGFDGKWVLHPGQVDAANEVFSPSQDDYNHAEEILDAYAYFTSAEGGALGAVMLVMLRSLSYGQALQAAYVGVSSSSPSIE